MQKKKAQDLYQSALSELEKIPFNTTALRALAEFIITRKKLNTHKSAVKIYNVFKMTNNMNNYPLLSLINSPEDLRLLNKDQLPQLCQELRAYLLESVSQTSGHLASGFRHGGTDCCATLCV